MKRIGKEMETIKNYLAKMIELNLQQIKIAKPTTSEKRIIESSINKKEFLKWMRYENEIFIHKDAVKFLKKLKALVKIT